MRVPIQKATETPAYYTGVYVVTVKRIRKRSKEFFLDFLTLEDGTDKLSRNVSTELPLNAA